MLSDSSRRTTAYFLQDFMRSYGFTCKKTFTEEVSLNIFLLKRVNEFPIANMSRLNLIPR